MSKGIYCTYLVVYRGDKLPSKYGNSSVLPFLYIGSTFIEKIKNGYRGSVSSKKYAEIWKKEVIQNPHLFEVIILSTHNTREEATAEELHIQQEVKSKKSPIFVNMADATENGFFSCKGIKKPGVSFALSGRTSETYEYIANRPKGVESKMFGRTKENDLGVAKAAEKNRGKPKPGTSKALKGRSKSTHDYIARVANGKKVLNDVQIQELLKLRNEGFNFKEIYKHFTDSGVKVAYSSLSNIYKRENLS